MAIESDFPSWPTFPSGLEGDWVDADRVLATNVMEYETPNRLIMLLMRNQMMLETYEEWVRRFTPKQAEAVELREDGFTQEEIGQQLGIVQRSVADRLELAQKKLVNRIPLK